MSTTWGRAGVIVIAVVNLLILRSNLRQLRRVRFMAVTLQAHAEMLANAEELAQRAAVGVVLTHDIHSGERSS